MTRNSTQVASYSCGASNQRLISTDVNGTTYYAWDGGSVIAEYRAGANQTLSWQRSYVYLGGRLLVTQNGTGIQMQHPDRLGTRLITEYTSGNAISEQVGLPYGTSLADSGTWATGAREGYQNGGYANPHRRRFTCVR